MSKKALVAVADGTEELEAVAIVDCLRRAGAIVTVASAGRQKEIITSRKIKLVADALISDCAGETYDLIALPGGMPGAENLRDNEQLADMLKEQARAGRFFAAVCASPAVVLQHHGLLAGRSIPVFPQWLTSSKTSWMNLLLWMAVVLPARGQGRHEFGIRLVEVLCGKETAKKVAQAMLAEF